MLRKLIMLAITSGLAKKLYDHYRQNQGKTPFPTSSRPREKHQSQGSAQRNS